MRLGSYEEIEMDTRFCNCKDCLKQRRKGRVLWHRLLRHFGPGAYFVSDYVEHPKFRKGRRPEEKKSVRINEETN